MLKSTKIGIGRFNRSSKQQIQYFFSIKTTCLAIASALLNDPEILILDEPTNGFRSSGIHQIRDIIKQIAAKGTTIYWLLIYWTK
jgi:ABC-2 type transport system ATP-binding protein